MRRVAPLSGYRGQPRGLIRVVARNGFRHRARVGFADKSRDWSLNADKLLPGLLNDPSLELRSMNARCDAEASAWIRGALPNDADGPYASTMLRISLIVVPPEEEGGIAK